MAWYNPFSWGEKAVDNVLDKNDGLLAQVGNWVGNMNLTKEEVIEFNAKTVLSVQEFVKATLSESTARSRTRRGIAVLWVKAQLGVVLMACIAAPWDKELASFYYDIATSTLMNSVTMAICIFFFGSYGIARYNESKK